MKVLERSALLRLAPRILVALSRSQGIKPVPARRPAEPSRRLNHGINHDNNSSNAR
jgi:hypothetical protein